MFFRRLVLWSLAVALFAVPAHAERSPYRAEASLDGFDRLLMQPQALSTELKKREPIAPASMRAFIPGQGFISTRFTTRWNKTWKATITQNGVRVDDPVTPVLLQGKMSLGRRSDGELPASASIIDGKLRVSFFGKPRGSRQHRRSYSITIPVTGDGATTARVSSVPESALKHAQCATAESQTVSAPQASAQSRPSGSVNANAVYNYFQLATDTDPQWFATYGSNSNAEVAAIVNDVAVNYYQGQLGLSIDLVGQNANNGVYTSNSAETLLDQTISQGESIFGTAPDLYHLFSGKDFTGSTVGLAYVGVTCAGPGFNGGISQDLISRAVTTSIVAHEIGHNFNAEHDTGTEGSVMFPSVSDPPATTFSQFSRNQIQSFYTQNASCLEARESGSTPATPVPTATSTPGGGGGGGGISPTPDPGDPGSGLTPDNAVISLNKRELARKARFSGFLFTPDEEFVYVGFTVEVYVNGEFFASAVTDEDGFYSVNIKYKSLPAKKNTVQAIVQGTSVASATKKVRK